MVDTIFLKKYVKTTENDIIGTVPVLKGCRTVTATFPLEENLRVMLRQPFISVRKPSRSTAAMLPMIEIAIPTNGGKMIQIIMNYGAAFELIQRNIVYLRTIKAKDMFDKQIIKDQQGTPMGVFIPIQTWNTLIDQYPDIETLDSELPQWEKEFIDKRLDMAQHYPERLKPIEMLFETL